MESAPLLSKVVVELSPKIIETVRDYTLTIKDDVTFPQIQACTVFALVHATKALIDTQEKFFGNTFNRDALVEEIIKLLREK